MTQNSWEKIRKIIDHALDLETAERAAYLDSECAGDPELRQEIDSLLEQEEPAKDFIENPILTHGPRLPSLEREAVPLPEIEGYEILDEIGYGGMARVYEARRFEEGMTLHVAIKVLRKRMLGAEGETDWRFRHEGRILASLEHPYIARIFGGGTTAEGLPYFVMEYVEGKPLDAYCDENKLPISDRIKIFRKVCSAVEYAHRKLIVHRDIKPGNILVTPDGEPKLLDFGIAKLLDTEDDAGHETWHMTLPGMQPMTPSYASPEQFKGETITIATDVYSLGVVLYELLTGHNPHRIEKPGLEQYRNAVLSAEPELPSQVISRAAVRWKSPTVTVEKDPSTIEEERSTAPRRLRRDLSGDLDKILLKTLRKEPEERYRSALSLSEDLGNFLRGLPVAARRGEVWYQTRKYLRLHRLKFSAALGALLILAFALFHQYRIDNLQERDDMTRSFLTALIQDGETDNPIKDFLNRETPDMLKTFNRIGKRMADNGELEQAERVIRRTIKLKEEMLEGDERKKSVVLSLHNLAAILTEKGDFEEASAYHDQVVEMHKEINDEDPLHLLRAINNRAVYYQDLGKLDQAEQDLTELFEIAEQRGFNSPHMLPFRNNQAYLYLLQAKAAPGPETRKNLLEAEEILLEVHSQVQGGSPEFNVLKNLAEVQALLGKSSEALANARRAHELVSRRFLSKEIAEVESVLGSCLSEVGEYEEAVLFLERASDALIQKLGEDNLKAQEAQQRLDAVQARLQTTPPNPDAPPS